MCQLLGMNCNTETDICFSFEGFVERGGNTDIHADGWGIAFFEDKACRTFHDTLPAAESPIAQLVKEYPIKTLNSIAHIRKASIGQVQLSNTHPFQRELWGRHWIFAHNGDLWNYKPDLSQERFQAVGTSDSEHAFCAILNHLSEKYATQPTPEILHEEILQFSKSIAEFGTFNFLLSNGEFIMARCTTNLHYLVRKAPFSKAHLSDKDVLVDFKELTSATDRVAVIATEPLTDNEEWIKFNNGELILFKDGKPFIGHQKVYCD